MTTQTTSVTPDTIRDLLNRSNAAVERALIVLYARQTADEQATETARYQNGRGFSAVDAEILSSFACQVQAKVGQTSSYLGRERKLGECLSPKQMDIARRKVVRYVKQLAEAAEEKAGTAKPVRVAKMEDWPSAAADMEIVSKNLEAEMWDMEARGDREGTLRDEQAKAEARQAMEASFRDPEHRTFRSIRNDISHWAAR
jgi:hypothetical protein